MNLKKTLVKILLWIDRNLYEFVQIKVIETSSKNEKSYKALRELWQLAKERNVRFWISGSWALTMLSGKYFKEIDDIDILTVGSEMEKIAELLNELGYVKGISKWPDMELAQKDGIQVEYINADYPGHVLNGLALNEYFINFREESFQVIEPSVLEELYLRVFLRKGRSIKADLKKFKLLLFISTHNFNQIENVTDFKKE